MRGEGFVCGECTFRFLWISLFRVSAPPPRFDRHGEPAASGTGSSLLRHFPGRAK